MARSLPLVVHALLLLAAAPASALVLGIVPDPGTTPDANGTQAQIEFLGATVGAVPVGGTVLAGAVGPQDDVIVLRFTNVGTQDLLIAAIQPVDQAALSVTAAGVTGGFPATGAQISSTDLASVITTGFPTGQSIDVFYALGDADDGEQLTMGAYGSLVPSALVATLSVPEPSLVLLLGGAVAALRQRPSRA